MLFKLLSFIISLKLCLMMMQPKMVENVLRSTFGTC